MGRYVLSRCRQVVPVLFGVTLITFLLIHVGLGDPVRAMMGQRSDPEIAARIRTEYGLDKPLWNQYTLYMGRLLVGDLGYSYRQRRPVSRVLAERLPATVRLAFAAMVVALLVGGAAGIIAAVRHNTLWDLLIMTLSLLGISLVAAGPMPGNIPMPEINPLILFSFVALLPWNYFTRSLQTSSNSLLAGQGLLTKVYFPRLVLPAQPLLPRWERLLGLWRRLPTRNKNQSYHR